MPTTPEPVMDVAELCRARDLLGYSDEVLAADLGLPPNVVKAWASGRAKVPPHIARDLRWRAALIEQEKMFASSGLPTCAWLAAFEAQPIPDRSRARTKRLEDLIEHGRACPTCQAREEWLRTHCPPLPEPPLPMWVKGLRPLFLLVDRLPKWAHPAVFLGFAFGAYSLLKILFLLPAVVAHPLTGVPMVLGGLALSISIGAVLGLLYGGGKHLWAQFKARRLA